MPNTCEIFGCKHLEVVNFVRMYNATISSDVTQCKTRPSKLNAGVILALVLLYFLSYCLTFLEVYARRLRRKVASSFFQMQEEKRITFLIDQIITKRRKRQDKQAEHLKTKSRKQEHYKIIFDFLCLTRLGARKNKVVKHTEEKQEVDL